MGWKHGVDIEGNARKVKCNYCPKIVSGGIFRFKHHLAGSSEDSEPCVGVPEDVRLVMQDFVDNAKAAKDKKRKLTQYGGDVEGEGEDVQTESSQRKGNGILKFTTNVKNGGGVQATMNQIVKKNYKEQVDLQVAKFFYTSAIPFNAIRNPEFMKMLDMVARYGIGYKHPSFHDIRVPLLKRAVKETHNMLDEFKQDWKKNGCTIMSDGWTDMKRRSICNFLVNSPMGTVFLYSLDTSDISKTTDKVFKMLDDVVEHVGEENVVQVVTDNAANYKAAGQKLMEKRKNLYWTPCAAHCIDLILEDFEKKLKVHESTIKKGRKITTFIYSRTMLIPLLKHFTKDRELIRPGATRFATSYLTLGCLNELKVALMTMFGSEEWKATKVSTSSDGKKVQSMVLDSRLWNNITICLKAAIPLMSVLRLVDSDENPAMGFLYAEMHAAKEKIKSNFNSVQRSYEPVWKIIDERWENQLHKPLHAAAYYLNPRFHYDDAFVKDLETKQGLFACVDRMTSDPLVRHKIHNQIPLFQKSHSLFGDANAKSSRKTMAPADWWSMYGDGCPELKNFAIRILSLTCSSSGCERNWSAFEMVHTKRRNRLHQQRMNDLVYVMYNNKLRSRQVRRKVVLPFDDIESDDEWITEDVEEIDEQSLVGDNDIVGENQVTKEPTLEGDPEHLIFDPILDEPLSSGAEFDDDDHDSGGDE
ncbi:uncharacterized protein LOC130736134 [Lotus japonicus]|uniref:uncharacterized protein LOC130736134 n=1 Tax=Lotus japonicus TaxID=34305 RepID=UPI002582EA18|nr:uncharacterized protein LOC130736134 [Lotus japonicus]